MAYTVHHHQLYGTASHNTHTTTHVHHAARQHEVLERGHTGAVTVLVLMLVLLYVLASAVGAYAWGCYADRHGRTDQSELGRRLAREAAQRQEA